MKYSYFSMYSILLVFCIYITPAFLLGQEPVPNASKNEVIPPGELVSCDCADPTLVFPEKAMSSDTAHCYSWPFQGSDWVLENITINTYDADGRLTESTSKYWDDDIQFFVPSSRRSFTYTAEGLLELDIYEFWNPDLNGGSWDPINKKMHEYDSQGKETFTQIWFSTYGNPAWQDGNKVFLSYNASGLKDTVFYQYWNTIQNDWYYSYRYRYVYDDDQQLIEYYKDWANNLPGDFVLNVRDIYIRDSENLTLEKISQYYNGGTWGNDEHELSELNDAGKPLTTLYQNWDPTNQMWDTLVMNRDIFTYNEEGLLEQHRTQSYYIMWVDMDRTYYSYYDNGMTKEVLVQEWQSFYDQWVNAEKCEYPLPENTTTGIASAFGENTFAMYPNPASEQVNLSTHEAISQVSVYNTIGQEVYVARPGANEFTLKTAAWDEGLYFITVKGKDQSITKKLIIRH